MGGHTVTTQIMKGKPETIRAAMEALEELLGAEAARAAAVGNPTPTPTRTPTLDPILTPALLSGAPRYPPLAAP